MGRTDVVKLATGTLARVDLSSLLSLAGKLLKIGESSGDPYGEPFEQGSRQTVRRISVKFLKRIPHSSTNCCNATKILS